GLPGRCGAHRGRHQRRDRHLHHPALPPARCGFHPRAVRSGPAAPARPAGPRDPGRGRPDGRLAASGGAEMTRPLALPARPRPRVDVEEVAALYRQLLLALGEDPDRDGLADTPRRVAAWWQEFLDYDPGRTDTAFAHAEDSDQFVLVTGIGAW